MNLSEDKFIENSDMAPPNLDNLSTTMEDLSVNENEDKKTVKRSGYLEWDEYFMAMAFLAAQRSKDPATQVGAVIVSPDKKIVGIGYNGMPMGCSDDEFPWGKEAASPYDNKYFYVCHAELNAILNKNVQSVKGCRLYVVLFPCNECAKLIIQSEISEIYYMSDKHANKDETKASKRMLDASKVVYKQFRPKCEQIVINFDVINSDVRQ